MQVLYIYTQRNYEAMFCYIHTFDAFLVSATKTHTGYIKCSHLCLNNKTHLSWALFAQRLHNTVATKTRLYAGFAFLRWTNGLRHDATPVCDFRCRRSGRKRGVTCNSPFYSECPVLPSHPFLHRRRFMSVTSSTARLGGTTMPPQSVFVSFIQNSEAQ